jgi:CubicO group peptidase (beta-lactamase class C family)
MSGRDWARLGNLYLQDGVWNGERLLPEGFVKFVSTLAPAWASDGRPVYGGFFWINGDHMYPVPPEAYYMAGAGGQRVIIIPRMALLSYASVTTRVLGPGQKHCEKRWRS